MTITMTKKGFRCRGSGILMRPLAVCATGLTTLLALTMLIYSHPLLAAGAAPKPSTLQEAVSLRKLGCVNDAIELLESLNLTGKDDIRLQLELAVSYLKNKQYQQADEAVERVFALAPSMKDNKKLLRLKLMISQSLFPQAGQVKSLREAQGQQSINPSSVFKAQLTTAKGYDHQTSSFPFFEFNFDDDGEFTEVVRKDFEFSDKSHYTSARLKAQYRSAPVKALNLFGEPSYVMWRHRLNYFQRNINQDGKYRLVLATLDSGIYLIQPKSWALNANYKAKWHHFQGDRKRFDQSADINFTLPFDAAKIKLGYRRKVVDYLDDVNLFADSTSLAPYMRFSYRFSPSLMATLGARKRTIDAENTLIEGSITRYATTLKYDYSDSLAFTVAYYQDDLAYDIVDIELGLNSGELKRTLILGTRYEINENWQLGFNGIYVDKKQNEDFGQDQLKRLETFVRYSY